MPPLRLSREELLDSMERTVVSDARRCVGIEWEKEAVDRSGRRLPFAGEGGIEALLRGLEQRHAWQAEHEGESLVGLSRDGAHVSLEPGGQVEFSSAPQRRLVDIEIDLRRHLSEIQDVTSGLDVLFLHTGFTPLQPCSEIEVIPKLRYRLMEEYLRGTGELAHQMMKGTTSVQLAFDFNSPEDCCAKFGAALGLSPVVTALVANSPLAEGTDTGCLSYRTRCWQRTDPRRTGLLDELRGGGLTVAAYLDWALSVPMMYYSRDGALQSAGGMTFNEWMQSGIDDYWPQPEDFDRHLTAVFPEVRLKSYLEIRGGDNGPIDRILGLAALWKGLLYDRFALGDARELEAELRGDGQPGLLDVAVEQGLEGSWQGRSLQLWAAELVDIAAEGLLQQSPDGPAEVAYLAPLQELVDAGRSPGRTVLEQWQAHDSAAQALAELAYPPLAQVPIISPEAGIIGRAAAEAARKGGSR